jgi:hypothetical protein
MMVSSTGEERPETMRRLLGLRTTDRPPGHKHTRRTRAGERKEAPNR